MRCVEGQSACIGAGSKLRERFKTDFDFQVDRNGFSLKGGWFESILFSGIHTDHSCFNCEAAVIFVL
jgi:hypothetical protein